ncbi:MAG: glycosyltransferase family 39 protein [bacterium]|nr:MAG: glycosyltransferase family 39 protein [bacterium]
MFSRYPVVPAGRLRRRVPEMFMEHSGSETLHSDRRMYIVWGILIGGALILRALFVHARLVLSGDEVHYAESLHHFMAGRFIDGLSDYWSFLYPLVAVPFGHLYGNVEPALRLVSLISGAAVLVPVMLIAARLHGRRVALFSGVLIALQPTLITFSTAAMTESLYTLLVLFALLSMINLMERGGWIPPLLAGLLLGLAFQVRQEAQFILIIFALVILLGRGGPGLRHPIVKRVGYVALLAALFVVALVPYLALMHQKTGRWTTGSKAAVNLSSPAIWEDGLERERYVYSLNEEGTRRRVEEIGEEGAASVLWRQRRAILSRYLPKLNKGVTLIPFLMATPFLLILVPLGLFGRRWSPEGRAMEFLLLVLASFPFFLYAVFRIEIRYLVPFLPLYLIWGARGCEVIVDWLRENVSPRPIVGSIVLSIVFLSLVPVTVRRYASIRRGQPLVYAEVGRVIGDQAGGGRILAHSGCSVSFYAGEPEATFIPWTDPTGLLRYARLHGYRYLLVDEDYFRTFRPTLVELLGDSKIEGLTRITSLSKATGGTVTLYRLEPGG